MNFKTHDATILKNLTSSLLLREEGFLYTSRYYKQGHGDSNEVFMPHEVLVEDLGQDDADEILDELVDRMYGGGDGRRWLATKLEVTL